MSQGADVIRGVHRRTVLRALIVAGLASSAWAQDAPLDYSFKLGVASGDPSSDGFALWTRLAPRPLEPHGGMPMRRIPVRWEVAAAPDFKIIVASGEEIARPEYAHAIHAEARGLSPDRPYWYRFRAAGEVSAIGMSRTAPQFGRAIKRVRLAAVGCQNYEQGLFTAYRHLAREPVDFVFHYGDYIYENGGGEMKAPGPRTQTIGECYSLDDYRMRYAQYKSDPDLQAAHAAAPWFVTFDDHEVSNNWAGDIDQYDSPPEAFMLRRAMAMQAWYEHMPLRPAQRPTVKGEQLFRRASYGDLLTTHFLDTRQFRSDQPCGDGFKPGCPSQSAPEAQMLSAAEEQWLYDGLAKPTRWNLLAQQVMMLDLDRRPPQTTAPVYNMDSWAGYEAPRARLLNKLQAMRLGNVVVLTGDEHQHFANELRVRSNDPTSPIVAHEFVSTSIASGGDGPGLRAEHAAILAHNPDCHMICDKRGYVVSEVTPKEWRTTYKVLDQVSKPDGVLSTLATYVARHGGGPLEKA